MSAESEFIFGEGRRGQERPIGVPRSRVGGFYDEGEFRVQVFVQFDGSIVTDPLAWIGSTDPLDLGRWR